MEGFWYVIGLLTGSFCVLLVGSDHEDKAQARLLRTIRDGEARVITYQLEGKQCRAVMWGDKRLDEVCEGDQK